MLSALQAVAWYHKWLGPEAGSKELQDGVIHMCNLPAAMQLTGEQVNILLAAAAAVEGGGLPELVCKLCELPGMADSTWQQCSRAVKDRE